MRELESVPRLKLAFRLSVPSVARTHARHTHAHARRPVGRRVIARAIGEVIRSLRIDGSVASVRQVGSKQSNGSNFPFVGSFVPTYVHARAWSVGRSVHADVRPSVRRRRPVRRSVRPVRADESSVTHSVHLFPYRLNRFCSFALLSPKRRRHGRVSPVG